ncbi:hypothetical protein SNEBB_005374 [Seison nebaliae]|nr:hypothetical protein SNEBB_005374 [Seison nebaliae]
MYSNSHGKIRALQLWCAKLLSIYDNVEITNMTTSWRNGLAFCALIHRFYPHLIEYELLKSENILENNRLAFQIANEKLNIPSLLDAEDMLSFEIPDRLSIVTYVSQFYHHMKDLTPSTNINTNNNNSNICPIQTKFQTEQKLNETKKIRNNSTFRKPNDVKRKTEEITRPKSQIIEKSSCLMTPPSSSNESSPKQRGRLRRALTLRETNIFLKNDKVHLPNDNLSTNPFRNLPKFSSNFQYNSNNLKSLPNNISTSQRAYFYDKNGNKIFRN